jgi:hypothetical protein
MDFQLMTSSALQYLSKKFIVGLIFFFSFGLFAQDTLDICSFNIQFLGHFKERKNDALAEIVKNYDIVVVQEMVAPPIDGKYADGTSYKKDIESANFVEEMTKNGFSYWLSSDDTGPTKNHTPTTASEWWIAFYKPNTVEPDSARCYGFISSPLAQNANYERVPYAFPFRSKDKKSNFTLVSVHLQPGNGVEDRKRRQTELTELVNWSSTQWESNKDFYILGDCNIYDQNEVSSFSAQGVIGLNDHFQSTNTKMYESVAKGEPYDHVFHFKYSIEDLVAGSFKIIDLMGELKKNQNSSLFPLEPYVHDLFRTAFSDHVPVSFQIVVGKDTDL